MDADILCGGRSMTRPIGAVYEAMGFPARDGALFVGAAESYMDVTRTARIECVRAALAVERHRLAKGALPETLADCAPGFLENVPADPFTGRELRYERLRSGFVVYSVGEDGRDDGGWEPPSRSQRALGQTYDITFGVER
jgi:hypothetical protein